MSKQHQYYSESNYRDNEYYRDQLSHDNGDVDYSHSDEHVAPTDWTDYPTDSVHQSAFSDHDQHHQDATGADEYYEPYAAVQSQPTDQQNDEYFASDSDRGFNMLFDSALTETDDSADTYIDEYAYTEHPASPYDEQNFGNSFTSQEKSPGIQVYADDLIDRPQKAGGIQLPKPLIVVSSLFFLFGLATALFHVSKPDLSAHDIVQMESYDGIQQVPAIFNLTNLDECFSQSDCIRKSLTASKADIAEYTEITSAIREIPATTAVMVEEPREISFATVDTVAAKDLLPEQLQVKAQWSNVRAAPDMSGAIVTSLAKGTPVSIISSNGNWYEIQALNAQQPRGFMHRSTVESVSN